MQKMVAIQLSKIKTQLIETVSNFRDRNYQLEGLGRQTLVTEHMRTYCNKMPKSQKEARTAENASVQLSEIEPQLIQFGIETSNGGGGDSVSPAPYYIWC